MSATGFGCYPEIMAISFTEAEDLSSTVSDECSRRNIAWQKVSKETIKMRDEAEPEYSFPSHLKFTETVSVHYYFHTLKRIAALTLMLE